MSLFQQVFVLFDSMINLCLSLLMFVDVYVIPFKECLCSYVLYLFIALSMSLSFFVCDFLCISLQTFSILFLYVPVVLCIYLYVCFYMCKDSSLVQWHFLFISICMHINVLMFLCMSVFLCIYIFLFPFIQLCWMWFSGC